MGHQPFLSGICAARPGMPRATAAWPAIALAFAVGCARDAPGEPPGSPADWTLPHAPWYEPAWQPPEPARFRNPTAARYHMRRHFDDLRMIERLLVAGKLDEGKALAYLLVQRADDPGLAAWDEYAARVADVGRAVTTAASLDEALRAEARVAVACASCHAATQGRPTFAAVPAPPGNRFTPETRMARHVWAVDRLWEGLVGAEDTRWIRGLTVLAESPLPVSPRAEAPALASRLQALARAQLDTRATTLLEDRGAAYGDMLVACARCHAVLRTAVRRASPPVPPRE